jgi:hypothetical protein
VNQISDRVLVAALIATTLITLMASLPALLRALRVRREASEFDGSTRAEVAFTAPDGHRAHVSLGHRPDLGVEVSTGAVRTR